MKRLKVFTWPIHGSYFYYLTQANCECYVPVSREDRFEYGGKGNEIAFPVGANIHEVAVEEI